MAKDAGLVLAGRNTTFYYKAYDDANALPADTVTYGTAWTDYTDAGYTDGGFGVNMSLERASITVDQAFDDVLRPVTGRSITSDTTFAQMDPVLFSVAAGFGTVDTVAPGVARGHEDLEIPTAIPSDVFYTIGFEQEQQNGEAFRFLGYKGIPTGSPNPRFGVADQKSMIAAEWQFIPGDAAASHDIALFRRITPITA